MSTGVYFSSSGRTSLPSSSIVFSVLVAGVVAELHVADELVDPEVGVVLHLREAALGIADDDHVGVVEALDRDVALDQRLQQRERRFLLLPDRDGAAPSRA